MAAHSKIQIINRLQERGIAGELYKLGMLNTKLIFYANAYNYYDALLKTTDHERHEAIKQTATRFKVDRQTIYNVIKEMESPADVDVQKLLLINAA